MIRPRESILYTGISRTGKSTLFRQAISKAKRFIIIDTLDEYWRLFPPFPALFICSIYQLYDYLADNRHKNFRIVFSPEDLEDKIMLIDGTESTIFNEACRLVYKYLNNMVLGIEELANHTNPNYAPQYLRRLVRSGGHFGISIYATTQRPKEIWTGLRGQLTKLVSFKLYEKADIDWIAEAIRNKNEAKSIADLKNLKGASGPRIKNRHYKEYVL